MTWSYDHDILLCREILLMKPYRHRPGSKESGNVWTSIAEDLNNITEVSFNVSQKSVRDHFRLLLDKYKSKIRNEESASGIDCEETELDQILQNLKEESDEAAETHENVTNDKKNKQMAEKSNAKDVRNKAMESLCEIKKRKALEGDEEFIKTKRNTGSETMIYLKERANDQQKLREQELELKREELNLQRQQQQNFQQQQTMLMQQLAQQQQLMMGLIDKLVNK